VTVANQPTTDPLVTLELVCESKIGDLLPGRPAQRYEASGVRFKGDYLYVVFDDAPDILRIRPDWSASDEAPTLIETHVPTTGYEDITYQPFEKRWYCLIEASETRSGGFKPRIDEFDAAFRFIGSHWLDFPVRRENKGIEGLSTLRYRDADILLGLCEGNACKSGSAGREPGQGHIQVFRRTDGDWRHTGTIKLPSSVLFEDHASLDFSDRYATVISQVSSAMWVGRVRSAPTSLDDLFEDKGRTALFPRDREGRIIYCNLEGVTWLPDHRLVVVSNKAKPDEQASRCRRKDQSIHIFKLPARG
jgi:hypothetical protein